MFLWMQMADPPAFRLFGFNVPKSELRDKNLDSLEEFILPVNFLKANETSLFSASRVKEMCFCSLDNCEDVGDPISPVVFQETHRIPPSGTCAHVFLSNRCRCTFGGWRESRRVANANVDEYKEHSQDVHRLHLLVTRLNKSSWWSRWSLEGHRSHIASQRAKWRNPKTSESNFVRLSS